MNEIIGDAKKKKKKKKRGPKTSKNQTETSIIKVMAVMQGLSIINPSFFTAKSKQDSFLGNHTHADDAPESALQQKARFYSCTKDVAKPQSLIIQESNYADL